MLINYGFDIAITVPQPTPLITLLDINDGRRADIQKESAFVTKPAAAVSTYRDQFGNRCRRIVAPKGDFQFTLSGTIADAGKTDFIDT
ncbi:MAG TPA: transglutaminase family protein, partial [Hyphomicrobium sp.]|nr:transglutaminase family protein [Hyphomicrobium sp.]